MSVAENDFELSPKMPYRAPPRQICFLQTILVKESFKRCDPEISPRMQFVCSRNFQKSNNEDSGNAWSQDATLIMHSMRRTILQRHQADLCGTRVSIAILSTFSTGSLVRSGFIIWNQ